MAHLAMITAAIFWSSASVVSKATFATVPFIELVFIRFALGATTQWVVAFTTGRARIRPTIALRAIAIGVLEPGIITLIAYWGLTLTTAVHVVVIFALMPIVTVVFARLLISEPLRVPVVVGSLIALAATAFLIGDPRQGAGSFEGDALAMTAMVLASGAALVLRRNAQAHAGSAVSLSALQLTGGAASSGLVMLVSSPVLPFAWLPDADGTTLAALAYIGFIVSGSSMAFYNFAFRRIEAARVSLYVVLITPLGVVLAALLLDEAVSWLDAGLVALIVAGVALPSAIELRQRRARAGSAVA
ncbi:MAG: DMT family transporter [Alphaproteobacteria bacterium]|nr:DMT family transporter [Alphaproteobacteria bacterium]